MDKLYTDELTAERAKRPAQVHPEWLVERGNLLKPTNRRRVETIAVATLLALGTGEVDLVHAIALAFGRRATIHAIDSGLVIKPDDGASGVNAAMADWLRAKRSAQTKPGRRLGNASRQRRPRPGHWPSCGSEAAVEAAHVGDKHSRNRQAIRPVGEDAVCLSRQAGGCAIRRRQASEAKGKDDMSQPDTTNEDCRCCGTCWHWVSVSGDIDGDCGKFSISVSMNAGTKCSAHRFDREVLAQ